ncbi:unnamed protein product [Merluccius merluccius]
MPPKKNLTAEDVESIKESLDFLSAEVAAIKQQQKTILDLVLEVKQLKLQNAEKDKQLLYLDNRVADLEQYTRMNDIIVTGLQIKPRSYAKAASATVNNGDQEPNELDAISVEQQVAAFLDTRGIKLDCDDIEACHTLPRRNDKDKTTTVIMRFVNRKRKTALPQPLPSHLNEHLTKRNADIARKARFMRKDKKIQSTWTTNCKVFIKLNGAPEEARALCIRSIEELDKHQ